MKKAFETVEAFYAGLATRAIGYQDYSGARAWAERLDVLQGLTSFLETEEDVVIECELIVRALASMAAQLQEVGRLAPSVYDRKHRLQVRKYCLEDVIAANKNT